MREREGKRIVSSSFQRRTSCNRGAAASVDARLSSRPRSRRRFLDFNANGGDIAITLASYQGTVVSEHDGEEQSTPPSLLVVHRSLCAVTCLLYPSAMTMTSVRHTTNAGVRQ
jgi:hypothetical protein